MAQNLRKPYEISLWEDELQPASGTTPAYFKEKKLFVIGTDTMDTPNGVFQPKLTNNVNGTNILEFSIHPRYINEETGEWQDNPYMSFLTNERKIKLYYDDEWYDFLIKDVDENSAENTYTYTTQDLYINELSKTGFNLIFDTELENNQGTISELTKKILADTDWELDEENSDIIQQTKDEPLTEMKIKQVEKDGVVVSSISFYGLDAKDSSGQTKELLTMTANNFIYGYYSVLASATEAVAYLVKFFQFIYREDRHFELDDDRIITNATDLYLENVICHKNSRGVIEYWSFTSDNHQYKITFESATPTYQMRGRRLIRSQLSTYDTVYDKMVSIYTKINRPSDELYYGYTESEYITPVILQELFGCNTVVYDGQKQSKPSINGVGGFVPNTLATIETNQHPKYNCGSWPSSWPTPVGYMIFRNTTKKNASIYNSVMFDSGAFSSYNQGHKLIMRLRLYNATRSYVKTGYDNDYREEVYDSEGNITGYTYNTPTETYYIPGSAINLNSTKLIKAYVDQYTLNLDGTYTREGNPIYTFNNFTAENNDFYTATATCTTSYSEQWVTESLDGSSGNKPFGFFLEIDGLDYYMTDCIQLYEYKEDSTGRPVKPGEVPQDYTIKWYCYYKYDKDITKATEVTLDTRVADEEPIHTFFPKYSTDYSKVRSIEGSESNCFNLIQTLCETFECWAKFNIAHNEDGSVVLIKGENDTYPHPKKTVSFKNYIGKDNYAGFVYGINLESIQRQSISEDIVTKLIVKDNSNEYAKDKYCTITRSENNPTKQNFIFNFEYYINQGLIDGAQLHMDLYEDEGVGGLGYYPNLEKKSTEELQLIANKSHIQTALTSVTANTTFSYNTFQGSYETFVQYQNEMQTSEEWKDITYEDCKNTELITDSTKKSRVRSLLTSDTALQNLLVSMDTAWSTYNKYQDQYRVYFAQKKSLEETLKIITDRLKEISEEKAELNKAFFEKYSRYIQEGSWISEEYMDDTLYYYDAESVLYESSKPKVEYTITVIDLSPLEDYEEYNFKVGDKTYMQDTKFFGYKDREFGDPYTPRRQEVIVSEVTWDLDNPMENSITVQNYKTQFEDLFQRVTATTQSLEYSTGEYDNAAGSIVNGMFDLGMFQETISSNSLILTNPENKAVIFDSDGITLKDMNNIRMVVRLTSGGIYVSEDAGVSWGAALTGKGINATYLNSGRINTDQITIGPANTPTFKWDVRGLSAYDFDMTVPNQSNRYTLCTGYLETSGGITTRYGDIFDAKGTYYKKVGDEYVKQQTEDSTKPNYINKEMFDANTVSDNKYYYTLNSFQEESTIASINYNKFVRFDRFGLYGIEQAAQTNWEPTDIENVKKNAFFGMTWDGFFMRSKHLSGGRVEITNEEDIKVYDGFNTPRVEIGLIGEDTTANNVYGIVLRNQAKQVIFETDNDGNLSITGKIKATSGEIAGFTIEEDHLWAESNNKKVIISPNRISLGSSTAPEFIVENDGSLTAKNGNFSGKVTTSVFEAATTRMVGGAMIYKTAEIIGKITEAVVELKNKDYSHFSVGDRVCIVESDKTYGSSEIEDLIVYNIIAKTATSITLNATPSYSSNKDCLLVYIGSAQDASNNKWDWLIATNSTKNRRNFNSLPNAITFNEVKVENNKLKLNPNVVIGDLSTVKEGLVNGLYAENAYLTGSFYANQNTDFPIVMDNTGFNLANKLNYTPEGILNIDADSIKIGGVPIGENSVVKDYNTYYLLSTTIPTLDNTVLDENNKPKGIGYSDLWTDSIPESSIIVEAYKNGKKLYSASVNQLSSGNYYLMMPKKVGSEIEISGITTFKGLAADQGETTILGGYIKGSTLELGGIGSGNGLLRVYDNTGDLKVQLDQHGFNLGNILEYTVDDFGIDKLNLKATSISIGNNTFNEYINNTIQTGFTYVRYRYWIGLDENKQDIWSGLYTVPYESLYDKNTWYIAILHTSDDIKADDPAAYEGLWKQLLPRDTISIYITSSNGYTFNNKKIDTVLTAHVLQYQASRKEEQIAKNSTELDINQIKLLGNLEWYVNGEKIVSQQNKLTYSVSDNDLYTMNFNIQLEEKEE